ncbi:MAG: flagellar basal body-associated FliL family protein [Proteobacteria bacterium]|nr:flagellar basal body-associated FliL family protein [Pseudomonadota bacterium]
MTEDLLEEMDGDTEEGPLGKKRVQSQAPVEKKSFVQRLSGVKKKQLSILVAGVAMVGMLAGGAFFFFGRTAEEGSGPGTQVVEKTDQAGPDKSENSDVTGDAFFEDIVALEHFVRIPLKGNSAMQFVSLDISLELIDHTQRKQVESMQEKIRKIVMDQVRETGWLELRTPEGKLQLKYELLGRINVLFPKVMVRNVYFTNLIMQ